VECKGDAEVSQMSETPPGTLMIRADSGAERGRGHVMRCLAIAQSWQDAGGDVFFVLHDSGLEQRLRSEAMGVAVISTLPGSAEDAKQVIELGRERNAKWLALDGYCFNEAYQLAVKQSGLRLLVLDDLGDVKRYYADFILNHNPHGESITYPRVEPYTRLLRGSEYALLRREFKVDRNCRMDVPAVARRLLITMGASDELNVTERVMQALPRLQVPGVEATVVVGGANPHKSRLREEAARLGAMVTLIEDTQIMPELMLNADLAISAGGGTCYELAYLRVPMFLITMAQNHERTCRAFAESGAAIDAGWFHALNSEQLAKDLQSIMLDESRRKSLVENASKLVDGEGASRVVKSMRAAAA